MTDDERELLVLLALKVFRSGDGGPATSAKRSEVGTDNHVSRRIAEVLEKVLTSSETASGLVEAIKLELQR